MELTRGQKTRATRIARAGSEEAYLESLKRAGSKGGKAKVPKGFAISGKASEAGKKSRRTK